MEKDGESKNRPANARFSCTHSRIDYDQSQEKVNSRRTGRMLSLRLQQTLNPAIFSKFRHVFFVAYQWRSHNIWATKRTPKTSIDIALEYYDSVYGPLYGKRWPSIRLALLCPNKYCAVVNNYGDSEIICNQLQNEGGINIREMFDVYKTKLSDKQHSAKRKKGLERIYDMDKRLERIAAKKRDGELEQIYPDGTAQLSSDPKESPQELLKEELIKKAKTPLEKSIAEATIDMDRQIDPEEGLSSSRLNEFVPVSKLKGKEGFVSEAEHFSFFNESADFPVTVEPEENLDFPTHLQIFTFDQGNISRFSPAKSGSTGVLGYYLMDAGSILPVLALGLQPGDTVLDMCAAPGGKSFLTLQTLYPDMLVCNDISKSRINRLQSVMQAYFYDWEKKVTLINGIGTAIADKNTFSKILVDVPCTNDRHSVTEDDNNIFKPGRNKERILLPQLQVELLFHALTLVKVGGIVVYSTCSLNPAQNDGVVQMALRKVWEETSMKVVVKDLRKALEPAHIVFRFAEPHCLRYGSLVVPYLPSNFGPMYFCKLQRTE